MIEIRFHGRGGQGSVLASYMLCKAAFLENRDVQSFTFFGAERRGAPVTSFARIASEPIIIRSQIYSPNRIVVLDPTLLHDTGVFSGISNGCVAFFNTDASVEGIVSLVPAGVEVLCMNATHIALSHGLGSPTAPIVNTAVLGGFAGATGLVGCDSLEKAIRDTVPVRTDDNVAAMKEAYEQARRGEVKRALR